MAVSFASPYVQFFDDNGNPLSGGLIYSYSAGTNTPKATYTDSTEVTQLSNPIVLDSAGRSAIWINGSYKFVIQTSGGVTIRTVDNVTSFSTSGTDINSILPSQTGNSGKVLTTNGTSAFWGTVGIPIVGMTDKVLYGLALSNNGVDAVNDIDIAAGACVSDDGTTVMTLSAITKRLDAAWAVGNGNGGLDTGAIANGTYHMWVINRPDTNVTDVLFSASASSPTMPTNYTKKKCIGSIVRAGATILPFFQFGKEFYLKTPVLDYNSTVAATASTITLGSIPTGVKLKALIHGFNGGSSGSYIYFSSLDAVDLAPSTTAAPIFTLGGSATTTGGQLYVWTNTSSQIRARGSATISCLISTLGWEDPRI